MGELLANLKSYQTLRTDLKQGIRTAQVPAALVVNRELVLLYRDIGKEILSRQGQEGWGTKVIDRLAKDLRSHCQQGLSPRNLKYMRTLAEAWPEKAIVQEVAAQILWFHNCIPLDKIKEPGERLWYLQQTIRPCWSRNVLVMRVETNLYRRQGKAVTNFQATEYSIRDIAKSLSVAEFRYPEQLPEQLKGTLPTIEEIKAQLDRPDVAGEAEE